MILGPAQSAPFGATSGNLDVVLIPAVLHGWALWNTSASVAAHVDVSDGPLGPLVAPIQLCPGESVRDWFTGAGIYLGVGLTVMVTVGTVEGAVWFRPATDHNTHQPLDIADTLEQLIDTLWAARP